MGKTREVSLEGVVLRLEQRVVAQRDRIARLRRFGVPTSTAVYATVRRRRKRRRRRPGNYFCGTRGSNATHCSICARTAGLCQGFRF